MKISIITPVLNSEKTIEQTVESVLKQTYPWVEYIIVDGGSSDKTLELLEKYRNKISKIISEKDSGIYDAMNKGIKIATGEIVAVLNSDDFYSHSKVLEKIAECFKKNTIDACYGNLVYVDRINMTKKVRYWKAGDFDKRRIKYGWIPPHPSFFVKKEWFEKFGYFRLDFFIAADYELLFRFILNSIKLFYLDEDIVHMREGGYSAKSISQRIKGWKELYKAWKINNQKPPLLFFIYRPFFKLHQYLFKK